MAKHPCTNVIRSEQIGSSFNSILMCIKYITGLCANQPHSNIYLQVNWKSWFYLNLHVSSKSLFDLFLIFLFKLVCIKDSVWFSKRVCASNTLFELIPKFNVLVQRVNLRISINLQSEGSQSPDMLCSNGMKHILCVPL